MTTTPGLSAKFCVAIRSAAAMFRCPVPRPRTERVAGAGPPKSISEGKRQRRRTRQPRAAAPLPKVPSIAEKFSPIRRRTVSDHADVRNGRENGPQARGPALRLILDGHSRGQRKQHREEQRSQEWPRIRRQSRDHERQYQRHEDHTADHQKQHEPDRESDVATGQSPQAWAGTAPRPRRRAGAGRSRGADPVEGWPSANRPAPGQSRNWPEARSSTSRARRSGATMSRTLSPSPAVAMQVTTKTRTVTFDSDSPGTHSRPHLTAASTSAITIRTADPLVIRHSGALAVLFVPELRA